MLLSLAQLGPGSPVPAYPNRAERNPKKKTPEWIAQYGAAFVHEVLRDSAFKHWWHAAADNQKRLLYLFGQQDPTQYERFVEPATTESDPTGLSQRLDRRILPLVPKHVRILSDKLAEQEFAPSVTVVDEDAEQDKEHHLDLIRTWQRNGDFLNSAGVAPPTDLPTDMPQDEEDVALYAAAEYQHEDALALEQKMALSLAEANWKQLDRDVVLHFFAFCEACGYLGTGPGGRPLPCLLLPHRVLLLSSASEDYRDMRAGAHVEYLTLGQLRAEAGDELTAEQYKWLAANNAPGQSATNWAALPAHLGNPADSGLVQIVRFSFLSEDDLVYKTSVDKNGNGYTKRKTADPNADFRSGQITRATATNVYEGVLVVGTAWSYHCRLAVGQLRDMDNPLLGRLPYQPLTPGLLAGHATCPMDEVMGISDFCQEQWLRLQEACLRAVPQGYNFDPETLLESIALLKGNGIGADGLLDIKPTLKMFYRTGNTVSKRKGRNGELLPPAVTKNDTGVPTDVVQYWQNLRSGMQMLETIMGSNAVVSAATPNPETGKGQSELAVQGTLSSLGSLAHGKQAIFEGLCRAMGLRIWLQEPTRPVTGTLPGAPGWPPTAVKPRPSVARRRFAFRIERLPSKEEWQQLYADAQRCLDTQQITLADMAYLREVDNLKLARRLLAQRAKRNAAQKAQADQQNQQATFEGQAKAAQAAEEAKQKTIQVQHVAAMELETLRGQNSARVAEIYAGAQHQAEQTRAQAQQLKTETQETGTTFRDALQHEAGREQAAQQAAGQGFADLVPAGAAGQ